MDLEQLLTLQDVLDYRLLMEDGLGWVQYEREFTLLLEAAGYTFKDYEEEIDRRWDRLDGLRQRPPVTRGLA